VLQSVMLAASSLQPFNDVFVTKVSWITELRRTYMSGTFMKVCAEMCSLAFCCLDAQWVDQPKTTFGEAHPFCKL